MTTVFTSRNRELLAICFIFVTLVAGFLELALTRDRFWDIYSLRLPIALVLFFLITHLAVRIQSPKADNAILPAVFLLTGVSSLIITRLKPDQAATQLLWISLGLALLVLTIRFVADYERLADFKYIFGLFGIALLLAPIFFGYEVGNARLWIAIGGYSFQPSEFAKIFLVIFFAAYLSEKEEVLSKATRTVLGVRLPEARHLGPLVLMWLVSLAILVFEKDLGTSLLFFSLFIIMIYMATSNAFFAAAGTLMFLAGAAGSYFAFSHVQTRINIWLQVLPNDVGGEVYQIAQSLFAMSAGGISGTGLGEGFLGSRIHMPAVLTDFIFSAIGEELGLAGTAALILTYFYILFRGIKISLTAKNDFGKLLAAGLIFFFSIQVLIIVGGIIKIIPMTGVTLPFVSYGGSSIVSNFILIGLLLSISNKEANDG